MIEMLSELQIEGNERRELVDTLHKVVTKVPEYQAAVMEKVTGYGNLQNTEISFLRNGTWWIYKYDFSQGL